METASRTAAARESAGELGERAGVEPARGALAPPAVQAERGTAERGLAERGPVERARPRTDPGEAELLEILRWIAAEREGPGRPLARLAEEDLAELSRRTPRELALRTGLGEAAARRVAAAFELGRRVERAAPPPRAPLHAPALVHAVAAPLVRGLDREEFHALLLDARHRLVRVAHVSTGTLSTSLVHPREVYAPALREAAAALVVVHNHPSGDPEPSAQDVEVTKRLLAAGSIVGVPLLDHVVIGGDRWVSLRERIAWNAP